MSEQLVGAPIEQLRRCGIARRGGTQTVRQGQPRSVRERRIRRPIRGAPPSSRTDSNRMITATAKAAGRREAPRSRSRSACPARSARPGPGGPPATPRKATGRPRPPNRTSRIIGFLGTRPRDRRVGPDGHGGHSASLRRRVARSCRAASAACAARRSWACASQEAAASVRRTLERFQLGDGPGEIASASGLRRAPPAAAASPRRRPRPAAP